MNTSCVSPSRCLAVWLVSCGLLAGLVGWVAPLLLSPPGVTRGGFDQVLVSGCAAGALLAAGWLWLGVSVVTARAWRGRARPAFPGLPSALNRIVLLACGVALTGGLVAPGPAGAASASSVQATSGQVTSGQVTSSPDRPVPRSRGCRCLTVPWAGAGRMRPAAQRAVDRPARRHPLGS